MGYWLKIENSKTKIQKMIFGVMLLIKPKFKIFIFEF